MAEKTPNYGYNRPAEGTLDWHAPINENFASLQDDIERLAAELGASVSPDYTQPSEGTLDWHVPLNENFASIEADIETLATEAGVADTGGYNTPSQGTLDWHVPINENFGMMDSDLAQIDQSLASDVTVSGTKSLTQDALWYSFISGYGADGRTVVDATAQRGSDLGAQVRNALSATSARNGRGIIWIPKGTYQWDTTVSIDPADYDGPSFVFHPDAEIAVNADWAFDWWPNNPTQLVQWSTMCIGGKWTLNGTGWIRATDMFYGHVSATSVVGPAPRALWVRNDTFWSENWNIHDTVFEGIDVPIRYSEPRAWNAPTGNGTGSFDQTTLSNLTFRDFDTAFHNQGGGIQQLVAVNLDFDPQRSGSVGMHFDDSVGNAVCTGGVYGPRWRGSDGTLFVFEHRDPPSIIDVQMDSAGATTWAGTNPWEFPSSATVSQTPGWAKLQDEPMFNVTQQQTLPEPFVDVSQYGGASVSEQVQNASQQVSGDATFVVPASTSYDWDGTCTIDNTNGRSTALVMPRNQKVMVNATGTHLEVLGDGSFVALGGDWARRSGSGTWLSTESEDVRVAVSQLFNYDNDDLIDVHPASKGRLVYHGGMFRDHGVGVRVRGAGLHTLESSHSIHRSYERYAHRFDAPVDYGRVAGMTTGPNDGSTMVDANAPAPVVYCSPQSEGPRDASVTIFDTRDVSTRADAPKFVEGWFWGDDEPVALYPDGAPMPVHLPDDYSRRSTVHQPAPDRLN